MTAATSLSGRNRSRDQICNRREREPQPHLSYRLIGSSSLSVRPISIRSDPISQCDPIRSRFRPTLRQRPRKFDRNREELARVAVLLAELGELVKPRRRLGLLTDKADNRVLECVARGRAGAIVTGDRAMLALGGFEGIRLISLRTYLRS